MDGLENAATDSPATPATAAPASVLEYRSPRDPATPRPGWRSMLARWAIVPFVIVVVSQLIWPPDAGPERDDFADIFGFFVGHMIGLTVLPLIGAAVVFLFSRSQLATTITFAALLILLGGALAFTSEMNRRIAGQMAVTGALRPLRAQGFAADQAGQDVAAAGIFDFASVRSPEDLDKRIAALDAGIMESTELLDAVDGAEADLLGRLEAARVGKRQRDARLAEFRRLYVGEARHKVQQRNLRLYRSLRELLTFLRENWGHWSYDAAEKRIDFDTEARGERFDALHAVVLAALAEMSENQETGIEDP